MRERIQWRLFIPVDSFSLINQNAAKDREQKKLDKSVSATAASAARAPNWRGGDDRILKHCVSQKSGKIYYVFLFFWQTTATRLVHLSRGQNWPPVLSFSCFPWDYLGNEKFWLAAFEGFSPSEDTTIDPNYWLLLYSSCCDSQPFPQKPNEKSFDLPPLPLLFFYKSSFGRKILRASTVNQEPTHRLPYRKEKDKQRKK